MLPLAGVGDDVFIIIVVDIFHAALVVPLGLVVRGGGLPRRGLRKKGAPRDFQKLELALHPLSLMCRWFTQRVFPHKWLMPTKPRPKPG